MRKVIKSVRREIPKERMKATKVVAQISFKGKEEIGLGILTRLKENVIPRLDKSSKFGVAQISFLLFIPLPK